ncbi:hypothetical protein [Aquimarina litoralis]|uniref:hypothetical protein n=1 Tax=Aquimarina litoralis TaxID=584605 RepID=UPI001C59C0BB|nr:hypothetical protein [Aquimarina litoralis]MBW1297898.1 hypothetical protein [Aquimarina litoralis]
MKPGFVSIVECFNISGIGLLTELQHFEKGIPPETQIIDLNTQEFWIVKKRVLSGILLVANDSEIYFDCETQYTHVSSTFKTLEDREIAVQRELEKRKNGIYWYVLKPDNKKQKVKPEKGSLLKIK